MAFIGNNLFNEYGRPSFPSSFGEAFPAPRAAGGSSFAGGDGFMSAYPPNPAYGFGGAQGAAMPAGMFACFMAVVQSFAAQIAQMLQGGREQERGPQYFSSASLRSSGDPHDAFSGTDAAGTQTSGTWDNMESHDHLITSNAIPGGFNVAVRATPPQANGATYNQSAVVTTNRGMTTAAMGPNGACSVIDEGQAVSLAAGQPRSLSNGETVTLNRNGSLTIQVANGRGGSVSTTLSYNGQGVDVNAAASGIALGGYLVDRELINS